VRCSERPTDRRILVEFGLDDLQLVFSVPPDADWWWAAADVLERAQVAVGKAAEQSGDRHDAAGQHPDDAG
jgi:hypothetical protein